jgi:hypothetical protein
MPSPGHISGEPSPASPNVTTSPTKTPTSTGSPSSRDTKSRHHHRRAAISLQAFPRSVSASQKIHLTGVDSREGAVLQVQRLEGTWADFPVTATVRGGIFQTYIYTGNTGVNRFRMYDKATGKISNVVRVTIH